MRRIITKEEIEKKETRNKIIIGAILVGLMILSTAGYAFFSGDNEKTSEKINYNGIQFVKSQTGLWMFEVQGVTFATQYNPQETQNITMMIIRNAGDYTGKSLFFIGDGQGRREIENNLWGTKIVPRSQNGCLEGYEEECEENSPIKSCTQDNVIILNETEEIKITQEENCIFINSPYSEQTRVADAFIFKILGIQ